MKLESNPENGTITMRGMIGDWEGCVSADDFHSLLSEHTGDLTIHFNSEGGSVTDGLSIYNAIANYEGEVTIHVDALAASIASIICCAANKVIINSTGKLMIHRCWTAAAGNCKDFRRLADTMDMLDEDLANVYSEKCGQEPEAVMAMMDEETWFSATKALEMGFADEIYDVKPKAAPKEEPKAVAILGPGLHNVLLATMDKRLRLRK